MLSRVKLQTVKSPIFPSGTDISQYSSFSSKTLMYGAERRFTFCRAFMVSTVLSLRFLSRSDTLATTVPESASGLYVAE